MSFIYQDTTDILQGIAWGGALLYISMHLAAAPVPYPLGDSSNTSVNFDQKCFQTLPRFSVAGEGGWKGQSLSYLRPTDVKHDGFSKGHSIDCASPNMVLSFRSSPSSNLVLCKKPPTLNNVLLMMPPLFLINQTLNIGFVLN